MLKLKEKPKDKPKNAGQLAEDQLRWAIGFAPDDLAANREGVLSDHQKWYLIRRRTNAFFIAVSGAVIAIFIAGVFLVNDLVSRKLGIGAVCSIFAALLIPSLLASWYRLVRDIRMNQVDVVQGRVRLDIASKEYTLHIGDLRLNVNKDVFLAFKNGDPYAIYYAPSTRMILSAEWLRD